MNHPFVSMALKSHPIRSIRTRRTFITMEPSLLLGGASVGDPRDPKIGVTWGFFR